MNPYTILGLNPAEKDVMDVSELIQAYNARLLQCRPDHNGNFYTKEFQSVQKAFETAMQEISQRPVAPLRQNSVSTRTPASSSTPFSSAVPTSSIPVKAKPIRPSKYEPLPIKNAFGKKAFDPETFNAVFEITKEMGGGASSSTSSPPSLQPFNLMDDTDLQFSDVVEGNGLMLIREPVELDSHRYGDVHSFEKQCEQSVHVDLGSLDPSLIERIKQQRQAQRANVLSEQEYQAAKRRFQAESLPRNTLSIHRADEELRRLQLEQQQRERMEALDYIKRKLHASSQAESLYPRATIEQFYGNQLDRFRTQ